MQFFNQIYKKLTKITKTPVVGWKKISTAYGKLKSEERYVVNMIKY
jgi:hypothetical protein